MKNVKLFFIKIVILMALQYAIILVRRLLTVQLIWINKLITPSDFLLKPNECIVCQLSIHRLKSSTSQVSHSIIIISNKMDEVFLKKHTKLSKLRFKLLIFIKKDG